MFMLRSAVSTAYKTGASASAFHRSGSLYFRHVCLNSSVGNGKNVDEEDNSIMSSTEYKKSSLEEHQIRIRNQRSASVAHLDPSLLGHIDKTSWLPARRKESPMPEGLPVQAIDMIREFQLKLNSPMHEDTSRVLALPKKLGGFGFDELTLVQENTVGPIAQGVDVLVRAPTGTGKTLAYQIPILERLFYMRVSPEAKGIPVIILCPTREQCLQTAATITHQLGLHSRHHDRNFGVTTVFGGSSSLHVEQEPLMQNPCGFLIGTPERINAHIVQTPGFKKRVQETKIIVMDEVDYLLKSSLSKDVAGIMSVVSKKKQTIMFSATLNSSVRAIAKYALRGGHQVIDLIKDPDQPIVTENALEVENETEENVDMLAEKIENALITAEVEQEDEEDDDELMLYATIPEKARQYVMEAKLGDTVPVITRLLDDIGGRFLYAQAQYLEEEELAKLEEREMTLSAPKPPKVLIFTPTARYTQFLSLILKKVCNPGKKSVYENVFEMHSRKSQNYRVRVAQSFGRETWEKGVVMVASDVAARGIDFKDVDLVIHLGMAASRAQYIHRVGRTARAGNDGKSLLLIDPADKETVMKSLTGLPVKMPEFEDLMLHYNDEVELDDIVPTMEDDEDLSDSSNSTSLEGEEEESNANMEHEEASEQDSDAVGGEELWDGVIARACAPLYIQQSTDNKLLREKRLRTLYTQTMCVNDISAITRNKTYEYMLQRVLRRVPTDDELGLNAERAYVSMLGLWRIPKAVQQARKNQVMDNVDQVTLHGVLTPPETGKRAMSLAKSFGMLGEHGELPTPAIAERVAKRLGLAGVLGINIGTPKTFLLSALEQQREPEKMRRKQFRKKDPAPFREYYSKHSTYKTMPKRVRTGELGYKVKNRSTQG